jgi:hypothetical protein
MVKVYKDLMEFVNNNPDKDWDKLQNWIEKMWSKILNKKNEKIL